MENIEKLIQDTLKLFPEEIDISDGELRNDNGFFSQKLSKAWHSAEDKNAITGNGVDFMIWSVFGLLHKMSRENFSRGIYSVSLNDINHEELKQEYKKALQEAEWFFALNLTRTWHQKGLHLNLMPRNIKILKYDEKNYIDNILQFVYNINCRIYLLYK